jgi:hypothetical protein
MLLFVFPVFFCIARLAKQKILKIIKTNKHIAEKQWKTDENSTESTIIVWRRGEDNRYVEHKTNEKQIYFFQVYSRVGLLRLIFF